MSNCVKIIHKMITGKRQIYILKLIYQQSHKMQCTGIHAQDSLLTSIMTITINTNQQDGLT